MTQPAGGSGDRGSESYFTDFRKGEVNELLEQLRSADKPGGIRQVDVVKKVVAYMTLGIDVSRLFPQMVMATNTRDLVQKKLVYLYLCAYAESHPELSLLAMNTLQKDFLDDNPMVRGLALRSLCSLRLPNLVEYVFTSIQKGIGDLSPYVRKTAVLGCAKLFHIAPARVRESGIIAKLYEMIRDKDAVVVSNCILALNEILADEGGIAVNQAIVHHLLNRLKEFNEWTTCVILDTAGKHNPNEEEVYDILNILDDRLKHANTAVVFATAKLFMKFTETLPHLHQQVYERLKAPLLTAAGSSPELSYVAMQHIQLLLGRTPTLFENEYKFFYIKANDPLYLKMLKVQLLMQITNEKNKHEVTDELCEYVMDIDVDLAKSAIKAVGQIAIRVEAIASRAVDKLLGFLDLEIDFVTNVTLVVMKDLLRKYPQMANVIIPEIKKCLKSLEDPEAKTAVVWMLGEYGAVIEDSPYLIEALVPNFAEEPPAVRLQLLTSTMKLFFKRPPECRPILGRLFEFALADSSNADVRDRALFYYRLLTVGVDEAKQVIDTPKQPINSFIEDDAHEYKDQLFEQFNTLSVVYGKPSSLWLKDLPVSVAVAQSAEANAAQNGGQEGAEEEEGEEEDLGPLQLVLQPVLDPKSFQVKWGQFPERGAIEVDISQPPVLSVVETQMSNRSVRCVASGDVGDTMKFYFYAQQVGTNSIFLVETVIEKSKLLLTAKFKGEDDATTMQFMDYFENAITTVIP